MKHFVIYALAAVVIFTMLGRFAAVETVSAAEPAVAPVLRMAKAAPAALQENAVPEEEVIQAGLLQANMSSMDDMYFKNALLEELGEGFSVHALSTAATGGDQAAMFRKMVERGYRLIVVELFDTDMADEYIRLAKENDIILIFIGEEPTSQQMAEMDNLYYVGFSAGNVMRELADAIILGWKNNQRALEIKDDDRLVFGVFTKDDYEENGSAEALTRYLSNAGIEAEMGKNAVTQAFEFNWKKEIDNIFYAGGEIIICDSSSYARQISEYLHDEEEYPKEKYERIQNTGIFLTVADATAQEMVKEGTAMFATGINGGDTGTAVAKLAKALLAGETPTAENVGIAPDQNRHIYITNRTVLSTVLTTQVGGDEDEE